MPIHLLRIFKDGVLIAATEEERFRRVKHWAGFPSMAVEFCLREAGVVLHEVDHIGDRPRSLCQTGEETVVSDEESGCGGFRVAVQDRLSNAKRIASLGRRI